MEDNRLTTVAETERNALVDYIAENDTPMEENLQVCPLCKSFINLFYVNFKEKLLMCENTDCEYPFGYEELQFVEVEENRKISPNQSQKLTTEDSASVSMFSSNTLADVQKLIEVHEMDDSQNDNKLNERRLLAAEKEKEQKMKENIENMKELSQVLWNEFKEKPPALISNERWIKNLINMQEMSGFRLLKEEEMNSIKKEDSKQLSIDINLNEENESVIEIQITNKNNSQMDDLEKSDIKSENNLNDDSKEN